MLELSVVVPPYLKLVNNCAPRTDENLPTFTSNMDIEDGEEGKDLLPRILRNLEFRFTELGEEGCEVDVVVVECVFEGLHGFDRCDGVLIKDQ